MSKKIIVRVLCRNVFSVDIAIKYIYSQFFQITRGIIAIKLEVRSIRDVSYDFCIAKSVVPRFWKAFDETENKYEIA